MTDFELRMWAYDQVSKDGPTGATPDYLMNRANALVAWVKNEDVPTDAVPPRTAESARARYESTLADYAQRHAE